MRKSWWATTTIEQGAAKATGWAGQMRRDARGGFLLVVAGTAALLQLGRRPCRSCFLFGGPLGRAGAFKRSQEQYQTNKHDKYLVR